MSSLIIEQTTPDDAAEYKVLAKNPAGEDSCVAKLTVEGTSPGIGADNTQVVVGVFVCCGMGCRATYLRCCGEAKRSCCFIVAAPKPKEPSPEKPKEPSPEKPKEPSPEKPKEPSPEKPKEPSPEKPKEPSPEKPVEEAAAPEEKPKEETNAPEFVEVFKETVRHLTSTNNCAPLLEESFLATGATLS